MKKSSAILAALCASLFAVNSATANKTFFVLKLLASGVVVNVVSYPLFHAANCNGSISNWWRTSIVKEYHEDMTFSIKKNTRETLKFFKKGKDKAEQIKNKL